MTNKPDTISISKKLLGYGDLLYGFCNKSADYDEPEICKLGGISRLVKLKQIHSSQVCIINGHTDFESELQGDALITDLKGICIGVYTADCVPVLLYDKNKSVVAAVHAGWRGTLSGIISEALSVMKNSYNSAPDDIVSVIGPCIGRCCFEVDRDVAIKFIEKYEETDSFINPSGEKYMLDLQHVNKEILKQAGVGSIEVIGICTKCNLNYHSYRREGKGVGRQLSFIGLRK
ncbi:MAG: peptidoglycan editing factor PgeF [Candidatus Dadabacteria bacterium]|nr:peptidoglycan editing factor PgeF [Candidatus Dadabacteria bacterium]NIV41587.1 peptidoglycan editing factor PgeF [Candidatus Dadabacteria bacterium]NIX15149.1 peptidoglycan editing factor PgeF [Candidatus Dadabacteria bacterium]NIY21794.1 peptidoglycan editing factor PgeF [Candidatus Dadabacteria bacterium]